MGNEQLQWPTTCLNVSLDKVIQNINDNSFYFYSFITKHYIKNCLIKDNDENKFYLLILDDDEASNSKNINIFLYSFDYTLFQDEIENNFLEFKNYNLKELAEKLNIYYTNQAYNTIFFIDNKLCLGYKPLGAWHSNDVFSMFQLNRGLFYYKRETFEKVMKRNSSWLVFKYYDENVFNITKHNFSYFIPKNLELKDYVMSSFLIQKNHNEYLAYFMHKEDYEKIVKKSNIFCFIIEKSFLSKSSFHIKSLIDIEGEKYVQNNFDLRNIDFSSFKTYKKGPYIYYLDINALIKDVDFKSFTYNKINKNFIESTIIKRDNNISSIDDTFLSSILFENILEKATSSQKLEYELTGYFIYEKEEN